MDMKKRRKISLADQIMIGALLVVFAGFLAYFLFMAATIRPLESSRQQIIQIAKAKTDLTKIDSFDLVTTDQSYYSLLGQNAKGQKVAILLPKDSGAISEIHLSDGVAMARLPQKGATTIDLALFKGKAVWQVNFPSGFKTYDFKTGQAL